MLKILDTTEIREGERGVGEGGGQREGEREIERER